MCTRFFAVELTSWVAKAGAIAVRCSVPAGSRITRQCFAEMIASKKLVHFFRVVFNLFIQ